MSCSVIRAVITMSLSISTVYYLRPNHSPEVASIFWAGPNIEATAWQMALVENVAAVALRAAQRATSTIHGESNKIATHRAG